MTAIERIIARIGIAGLLAVLLAGSVAINLWQFRESGQAEAECDARIATMQAQVAEAAVRRDDTALAIARETAARAEADTARIETQTVRYVERIREVRIPVPAECHAPMPDGVRDALADAAAAANRGL